jgi:DNA sulfur modification protein DndB
MNTGFLDFVAIRGRQGQSDYYVIHCPLWLVPRLFLFDEVEVPVALRLGRTLNSATVAELTRYLSMHRGDYVLSPLVASMDCDVTFEPFRTELADAGKLSIPLTTHLILQDGQHRRAAIQHVLMTHPDLGDDTIPIMLLADSHLSRSQRLFLDLNPEKTRRTLSQRVLHDQDSSLAALVRQMVESVPVFKGMVELEKTTISNRSTALFTLGAVFQATQALLGIQAREPVAATEAELARRFWTELGQMIPEWQQAIQRKASPAQLRQRYVHVHSVSLLAIGMAGHALIQAYPDDWQERLGALRGLDWSRSNAELWEGRAMLRGKMSKTRESIHLTANAIKQALGLPLTENEVALERAMRR